MAVVPVAYQKSVDALDRVVVVRWNALSGGDTGAPVLLPNYRLVQMQCLNVQGVVSGASISVEGALDAISPEWAFLGAALGRFNAIWAGFPGFDAVGAPLHYCLHSVGYRPVFTNANSGTVDVCLMFLLNEG